MVAAVASSPPHSGWIVATGWISGALGPLRPHAAAVVGVAAGRWSFEAEEGSAATLPEDDDGTEAAFGWGGLAGLGYAAGGGEHPVVLFLEARIFDIGGMLFARTPAASGPAPFGFTEADPAMLSVRAGVTLGF